MALGPVGHEQQCHLGLVDDLALLHRAARRFGWSMRLRCVSPELTDLLELAGLTEVLTSDEPRVLGTDRSSRLFGGQW